jgi:hypothetical protein
MRIPRGYGLSNKENIVIILEDAFGETVKIDFKSLRFIGIIVDELLLRYINDF